jgi:murein DD-endopeptidase MepM/ murein hydrolase activator NlpD
MLRFFRFEGRDGDVDYYDPRGRGVRKALLRTPIDGARLSSGFGLRRHPVLGFSRMHKGVDFAAPSGTPIQAAGDGVVEVAGWQGSYGNYVRIRHAANYSTAYGHMSRIGVKAGQRVKQGQVVGSVGSTGVSTGPHLHYETLREGQHINPLSIKLPAGRQLEGRELAQFQNQVDEVERRMAATPVRSLLAESR